MICVMAMNPHGNEAPQHPVDSDSLSRRFDEQRLRPNIDVTINPSDVLCGRGKSSFTHAGNRRFRDAVTSAIDEYNNSESRLAKSRVVQRIVENIKGGGGRFLKKERSTGQWVELDTKSCRDKVGHAIRDAANLIEARKQKEQRKKSSTYSFLEERGRASLPGGVPSVGRGVSSRLSPTNRFEDDDIFYGTLSEGKLEDEDFNDVVDPEDDPFVRHINEVLGPIPPQETRDPLRDFLDNLGRET
ncbi:expressed unknown protein [Seminavis robusta]|uniref:DUF6824 domain-containing protein n=1 Tax=Seminavis robusta TaxID=568900 RepID=A0A9N8EBB7_9STRA|nr:expressed unknown protein [Seminavis robusta]|eukprot:Sro714_g191640.1 n/a (244) ;mRNA; f:2666-3576